MLELTLRMLGGVAGCEGAEGEDGLLCFPCGLQVSTSTTPEPGYVLDELHRRHHDLHGGFRGSWLLIVRHESGIGPGGYYRVVETYWCSHEEGPK